MYHTEASNVGDGKLLSLAANENCYGCSSRVAARVRELLQAPHLYPETYGESLKVALSERHKISPDQIIVGPGSWALLDYVATNLRASKGKADVFRYRFSGFSYVMERCKYEVIELPEEFENTDRQIGSELDDLRDTIIFIANPSNPSGRFIGRNQIYEWVSRTHPSNIILVDEAYIEYVKGYEKQNSLSLVSNFDNLIVLRTFSKAYGLANLRIGWLYSSKKIVSSLFNRPLPYCVSGTALEAAKLALEDDAFVQDCSEKNRQQLKVLRSALAKYKIDSLDSEANFVSADFRHLPSAHSVFKENGLLYRSLSIYSLPGWIRMTVGDEKSISLIETSLDELVMR